MGTQGTINLFFCSYLSRLYNFSGGIVKQNLICSLLWLDIGGAKPALLFLQFQAASLDFVWNNTSRPNWPILSGIAYSFWSKRQELGLLWNSICCITRFCLVWTFLEPNIDRMFFFFYCIVVIMDKRYFHNRWFPIYGDRMFATYTPLCTAKPQCFYRTLKSKPTEMGRGEVQELKEQPSSPQKRLYLCCHPRSLQFVMK